MVMDSLSGKTLAVWQPQSERTTKTGKVPCASSQKQEKKLSRPKQMIVSFKEPTPEQAQAIKKNLAKLILKSALKKHSKAYADAKVAS